MKIIPLLYLPSILAIQLSGTLNLTIPIENTASALLTGPSARLNSPIFENQNISSFSFNSPPTGDYLLQIDSVVYNFPVLLVRVREEMMTVTNYQIGQVIEEGLEGFSLGLPLVLKGVPIDFVGVTGSFNFWQIISSNPLIPLLLFGALAAVGLLKLLAMVDPETMAEVTAQQAQMHASVGSLSNFGNTDGGLSKFLAKESNSTSEAEKVILLEELNKRGMKEGVGSGTSGKGKAKKRK